MKEDKIFFVENFGFFVRKFKKVFWKVEVLLMEDCVCFSFSSQRADTTPFMDRVNMYAGFYMAVRK